jgi:hypothetical protein
LLDGVGMVNINLLFDNYCGVLGVMFLINYLINYVFNLGIACVDVGDNFL